MKAAIMRKGEEWLFLLSPPVWNLCVVIHQNAVKNSLFKGTHIFIKLDQLVLKLDFVRNSTENIRRRIRTKGRKEISTRAQFTSIFHIFFENVIFLVIETVTVAAMRYQTKISPSTSTTGNVDAKNGVVFDLFCE